MTEAQTPSWKNDLRLIESGFPCHQVGAETQRERGASSALPPLYFLHVWWARRPLTPSRAAILASLLPADTDPDLFLRELGIEKRVVAINGREWTLSGKILDKIAQTPEGEEFLIFDDRILNLLEKENKERQEYLKIISDLREKDSSLINNEIVFRWEKDSQPLLKPWPSKGEKVSVFYASADPSWFKDLMALAGSYGLRVPNLYGYDRAYKKNPCPVKNPLTILDPTSGGGSIPFEALRLGHRVIANELNPVASVILHATLEYPARFGESLCDEIHFWGKKLMSSLDSAMSEFFPSKHPLPASEIQSFKNHIKNCSEVENLFNKEETTTYLYCRQVTCPNCGGDAPLLNTCWLSKESGGQWGVSIIPDGREKNGTVRFETYRVSKGKGPNGEDPDSATVNKAVGQCVHCRQAIDSDEIKAQARGESPHGNWRDRLYCVVAVRFQPKLDKNGLPQRFVSGEKAGQIKTEKVRFFRPANRADLDAVDAAEKRLKERWDAWDALGLIPTEKIPEGHKTREPLRVGMNRWCDMFTPRQLLGHLTLVEALIQMKPEIMAALGPDKGRAVVTYLQFAIDKCLDYNSRQTLWHASRGVIAHTFTRHDYSFKWTFGEMIFTGPNSGFAWGLGQILDAYLNICELITQSHARNNLTIINGTAAHMPEVHDESVDLVCIDPPYYNNVQYAELSDYFYVWMKRTLKDIYPEYFKRRLTNKNEEAVANPDRDGSTENAKRTYEKMMGDIFKESYRVLKNNGIMTLMFNHKSQDAWETLTHALIHHGWIISASFPVESESSVDIHHKEMAATVSSIFIACRKRFSQSSEPAVWTDFGGTGVQQRIQAAVVQGLAEFETLHLNPVDEMVASYGRALRVLSEKWPVIDGDEPVGPLRAMNEASRVVAGHQIRRITKGRLQVEDLSPEAAMALTLFGVYGLAEFPFDEALNMSKSLNIALESKIGGYAAAGRMIGYNTQATAAARIRRADAEDTGFLAPLVRKGAKLRIARPEERHAKRLEFPETEWDALCGLIMAFRQGDSPVARAYLQRHAEGKTELMLELLRVWAAEVPDESLRKEAGAIIFGLK